MIMNQNSIDRENSINLFLSVQSCRRGVLVSHHQEHLLRNTVIGNYKIAYETGYSRIHKPPPRSASNCPTTLRLLSSHRKVQSSPFGVTHDVPEATTDRHRHYHSMNYGLCKHIQSEAMFLSHFCKAWDEGSVIYLRNSLLTYCENLFDPSKPESLTAFIAQGGIDIFCKMLCTNARWLQNSSEEVVFAGRRHLLINNAGKSDEVILDGRNGVRIVRKYDFGAQNNILCPPSVLSNKTTDDIPTIFLPPESCNIPAHTSILSVSAGINIYNTIIRVITEAVVCSTPMGWYLYRWGNGALIKRLLALSKTASLRDGALILVQHILSVIGPAIDFNTCSEVRDLMYSCVNNLSNSLTALEDISETTQNVLKPNRGPMTTEIEISDRDSRTVLAVKSLALQHEVNIATLCRVVSLAVVAGIMSEAIPGTSTDDGGKRIEPFPQCLTRVQAIDKAMCSNVAYLLRIPNFVHSLMRLLEYRDQKSSMRIIRGNRTVTIMATEQVEIGSNTLPDDSDFDYEDEFDINEEASVVVSGDEFLSTLRTVAQLIPEGVQSPPNAISFIQQFIDIRNRQTINLDRGEGPTVSIDVRTRITNPTVNINEVDGAGTRANERNANNTTFEGAQQEIQQIAQGLTQDMPEANASDCLDFSWFIGQPPSKKYWRFDAMQISDAQHQPDYIRDLISRLNITNGAPVFVSTLLNSVLGSSEDILSGTELSEYLIDRMIAWNDSMALRECFFAVRGLGFDLAVSTSSIQSKMNDVFPSKDERWVIFAKSQNQIYTNQQSFISTLVEYEQIIDWRRPAVQKKHRMRQDRQNIINCQSEVYFVMNSLMMTDEYSNAHQLLTDANLLPRLNRMFGHVFFTESASNSVHYNPSGATDVQKYDEDEINLGSISPYQGKKSEVSDIEVLKAAWKKGVFFQTRVRYFDDKTYPRSSPENVLDWVNDVMTHNSRGDSMEFSSKECKKILSILSHIEPELFLDETTFKWEENPVEEPFHNSLSNQTCVSDECEYYDCEKASGKSNLTRESAFNMNNSVILSDITVGNGESSTYPSAHEYDTNNPEKDIDEDDDGHRHDPDTLRKLELLRVVHEFWNAQDRREIQCFINPGCDTSPIFELARKMAERIVATKEDPCVETTCFHNLEAFLRLFAFYQECESCQKGFYPQSKVQDIVCDVLMEHVLVDRILNACVDKTNRSNSLYPSKRFDSLMAALGEMIKYNLCGMEKLEEVLCDQSFVRMPDTPGRYARQVNDTLFAVLRRRLVTHSDEMNLFLRLLVLSILKGVSFPVNYIRKLDGEEGADSVFVMDTLQNDQSPHDPSQVPYIDVLGCISKFGSNSSEKRITESTSVLLSRLYFVRQISRQFVTRCFSKLRKTSTLIDTKKVNDSYLLDRTEELFRHTNIRKELEMYLFNLTTHSPTTFETPSEGISPGRESTKPPCSEVACQAALPVTAYGLFICETFHCPSLWSSSGQDRASMVDPSDIEIPIDFSSEVQGPSAVKPYEDPYVQHLKQIYGCHFHSTGVQPNRPIPQIMFEEDYMRLTAAPIGAHLVPILRGGRCSPGRQFVSFSFKPCPNIGAPNFLKKHCSDIIKNNFVHHLSHSGLISERCPNARRLFADDPGSIVYSFLNSNVIQPDNMESTEKLCVITSSVLLFLYVHFEDPHHGIENLLVRLKQLDTANDIKKIAISLSSNPRYFEQNRFTCDSSNPSVISLPNTNHLKDCGSATVFCESRFLCEMKENGCISERCDDCTDTETLSMSRLFNMREFGNEKGSSYTSIHPSEAKYCYTHGPKQRCFFVNFFRILSFWLSHYSSAQRYVETIFVCSQVPFAEWKVVAIDILRRLPYYFAATQEQLLYATPKG